jgi:hypothetical protein
MNNGEKHIFEFGQFRLELGEPYLRFLGIDDGKDAAYYHGRGRIFQRISPQFTHGVLVSVCDQCRR